MNHRRKEARPINEILNQRPTRNGSPLLDSVLDEFCAQIAAPSDEMQAERERYEGSLYEFTKAMWPIVEPAVEWKDGWLVHCECEHLEAVHRGEIKKLLINEPPRHGKSIRTSVAFFAWSWALQPSKRFIYTSYADRFVLRDSVHSRDVIRHEWYKRYWGNKFYIKIDRNQQHVFENSQRGFRFATTPNGVATGEGAEVIVADDIISAEGARSRATLEQTFRFWTQTMGSRFNDPANVARIITMQRFARGDLAGRMMAEEMGYETLVLPLECERKRIFLPTPTNADQRPKDAIVPTSLQMRKPELMDNRADGEILWPERFRPQDVVEMKLAIRDGCPGQLQQRPAPEGGTIIRSEWFNLFYESWEDGDLYFVLGEMADERRPLKVRAKDCTWFQCVDTAQTRDQNNDRTAIGTFCRTPQNWLLIYDVFAEYLEFPDQPLAMQELRAGCAQWDAHEGTWLLRGHANPWPVPIAWQGVEPKSTGESLIQMFRRAGIALRRLNVYAGDKQQRGASLVSMYQQGMVFHRARGTWRIDYETEVTEFPNSMNDDRYDVASYAAMELTQNALMQFTGDLIHNASVHDEMAPPDDALPAVFQARPGTVPLLNDAAALTPDDTDELAHLLAALERGHAQPSKPKPDDGMAALFDLLGVPTE